MDLFAYVDRTESGSPTATTPTATSFTFAPSVSSDDDPSSRSLTQLKKLGRSVYKDVWNEFYNWEPGYCTEILGAMTITQTILASKRRVAHVAKAMLAQLVHPQEMRAPLPRGAADGTDAVAMSVTHFDAPAGGGHCPTPTRTMNLPIPVVTIDAYPPHPDYESCSPASRSVLEDSRHEHTLIFLPYADDKLFPVQDFQAKFKALDWETPFDPDVEMIQIETVKRLYALHAVDIQDIDQMGMFQGKNVHLSHNTGLQWDEFQRDVLHWPDALRFLETQEKYLPTYQPNTENLRERLKSNLRTFCPSIHCLHSVCQTHGQLHASIYIPSGKPHLTGKDMILSEGVPCGSDCFRHIQDFEKFMETIPPSPSRSHHTNSLDTLKTVLGIAPDLFPCQLATICLKPCKQVFGQRLHLFPDYTILSSSASNDPLIAGTGRSSHPQQRKKTKNKPQFIDEPSHFTCELLAACAHPGPCTSNDCPCYVEKMHCMQMCRCGPKCERQWNGCSCNGRCVPWTCECVKGLRECIPGICINCDARGKRESCKDNYTEAYIGQTGKPCNNARMQQLASKPIAVKYGSYGLGAFAHHNMNPDTFLGTYVGHIMTDELADSKNDLAKHTFHNYLFEITPDRGAADVHFPMFDAAYLGNATRFFNHAKDSKANVDAKSMLVIGEHQIGFFTNKRVKAGQELFLDYGDIYWKDSK